MMSLFSSPATDNPRCRDANEPPEARARKLESVVAGGSKAAVPPRMPQDSGATRQRTFRSRFGSLSPSHLTWFGPGLLTTDVNTLSCRFEAEPSNPIQSRA